MRQRRGGDHAVHGLEGMALLLEAHLHLAPLARLLLAEGEDLQRLQEGLDRGGSLGPQGAGVQLSRRDGGDGHLPHLDPARALRAQGRPRRNWTQKLASRR